MRSRLFDDREAWLLARRGKITGSRLKDIIVKKGTGRKIGFYELIAERLAVAPDSERPMDRGTRLEEEAIERFSTETGKKVDTSLVIWERDDNDSIAVSPDGFIGVTEAVETKCLSSARHIEAFLTQKVPDEYEMQVLQYFIVNDKLKTLYFAFYDPRIPFKDFFYLTVKRKDVEEQVTEYLEYQRKTIAEVNEIVNSITF
jgi:predicted phage-related endonuclease